MITGRFVPSRSVAAISSPFEGILQGCELGGGMSPQDGDVFGGSRLSHHGIGGMQTFTVMPVSPLS
jgi:hypothetical protein